jgi:hypothetical protein
MKSLLLFFLLIYASQLSAQQSSLVQINDTLTAHQYEFSALAKWKNKILLIPQNRKNIVDSVFMIDSAAIDQSIQNNTLTVHSTFVIKNIKHVGAKKDSLLIGNILLTKYDGFEAAVVKNDTIFFSLEADTSFCYLIKGLINESLKSIELLQDTQHIPNTYNINNAGYESLALLPQKNLLITFFECNKDTATALAYLLNTSLKTKPESLKWAQPLYFRLTDVYALNDSELIGVNHLFTSKDYPFERDAYIQCENLGDVEKQLTNGRNIDTCFTQLIKLTINDNKISWQPLAFISLNEADNYEGIVSFKNGALIMVDGEPGNNPSKLTYVNLK